MKIRDFIDRQKKETPKSSEGKPQGDAEDRIKKYSKMSEEDLMRELFKVGSLSKGGVTGKQLDDFYQSVEGMLSPEQKERMRELILQLKNS